MRIPYRQIKADLIGCWLIASTALCAGIIINQIRNDPLPLVYQLKAARVDAAVLKIAAEQKADIVVDQPNAASLPDRLSLEEFVSFVNRKQGLVIDARPEIFHRLGHVPGALSLPRDDFEASYRQHRSLLESDKNQTLVIYCSGGSCEDSDLIEAALRKLGYRQISIFQGGWAEWTDAGLPQETKQ